jgi:hypothetical protein
VISSALTISRFFFSRRRVGGARTENRKVRPRKDPMPSFGSFFTFSFLETKKGGAVLLECPDHASGST